MPEPIKATLSNGYIATTSLDHDLIRIINPENGAVLRTLFAGEYISEIVALPDNQIIVAFPFEQDNFKIYEALTGNFVKQFSQGGCAVDGMILSEDKAHIIAGSPDKTGEIRIVNLASGQITQRISQYGHGVSAIHPLEDKDIILVGSCSRFGNIRSIRLSDGLLLNEKKQTAAITSAHQIVLQINSFAPMNDPGLKLLSGFYSFWSFDNENKSQPNDELAARPNAARLTP